MDNSNIPEEYRPISMWGYFGYEILLRSRRLLKKPSDKAAYF